MASKILYRVESGENDILPKDFKLRPTGRYKAYLNNLPPSDIKEYKTIIEDSLERKGGVDRRNLLFLFDELKDALIFSCKIYKGNAVIYTATVQPDMVLTRGDMNSLDILSYAINCGIYEQNPDVFDLLCLNYCKNGKTFSPCYEYLTKEATILNLICDHNDCKKFYSEYTDSNLMSFLSVERSEVYLNTLNKLRE
jgi:hypothetical protein